jgi:hypothetical protein
MYFYGVATKNTSQRSLSRMGKIIDMHRIIKTCDTIFSDALHAKTRHALSAGIFAAMLSPRLTSATMGRALAQSSGKSAKHQIKRMDRLVGNENINIEESFRSYAPWVIGARKLIAVSLDWTEYGNDKQSRIAINLVTNHGRATPLIWKSVFDRNLKNRRNRYEKEVLSILKQVIPSDVRVIVLADRGFSDTDFFEWIQQELQWDFVIRLRDNWHVEPDGCFPQKAKQWVARNGVIIEMRDARLTAKRDIVKAFITVKKLGMKEAWILASSISGRKEYVVGLYARRFTCEENFRDEKDDRFGAGFKETRVKQPERRDRFVLIQAIATILLTLLGAAGEQMGLDRMLRANTVRNKRTHSLYQQGKQYFMTRFTDVAEELGRIFINLLHAMRHVSDFAWLV